MRESLAEIDSHAILLMRLSKPFLTLSLVATKEANVTRLATMMGMSKREYLKQLTDPHNSKRAEHVASKSG